MHFDISYVREFGRSGCSDYLMIANKRIECNHTLSITVSKSAAELGGIDTNWLVFLQLHWLASKSFLIV